MFVELLLLCGGVPHSKCLQMKHLTWKHGLTQNAWNELPKFNKMIETQDPQLAVGPVYAQLRWTCRLEALADSYVIIPVVYL